MSRSVPMFVMLVLFVAVLVQEPPAGAAPDDEAEYKKIVTKMGILERRITNQSSDMNNLRTRIGRLEREKQTAKTSTVSPPSSASTTDLAKLKRDVVTTSSGLKRLETKVSSIERVNLQREIDRLKRDMATLKSEVQRLKSR